MKTPLSLIAITATLATGAAHAQNVPEGFYTNGRLQYESLHYDGDDMRVLTGDVTIGLSNIGGSVFGAELGLKFYNFSEFDLDDAGLRERGFFPIVYADTDYGRISFGMPRAATGSHFTFPTLGGSQTVSQLGTLLTATSDLFNTIIDDQVGLRYDGTFGDTSVSVSYHRANDILGSGVDATILSAAGSYKFENLVFAAGLQYLDTDGYDDTALMLKAAYDAGQYGGELMYAQALTGGAGLDLDVDTLSLTGFYKPIENLTLKADIIRLSADGDSTTIYGANVEYDVWNGIYVGAGIADAKDLPGTVKNIYAGYNFAF